MKLRALLTVVLVLLLVLLAGVVWLGLNPPEPPRKPIERTLPNDKFQVR